MIKENYVLHKDPVPVQYSVLCIEGRDAVLIVLVRQREKAYKWAIRDGDRGCFSKNGKWDFEPMPSNRTDDWIATHRFDTVEEATLMAHVAAEAKLTDYKRRVEHFNKRETECQDDG